MIKTGKRNSRVRLAVVFGTAGTIALVLELAIVAYAVRVLVNPMDFDLYAIPLIIAGIVFVIMTVLLVRCWLLVVTTVRRFVRRKIRSYRKVRKTTVL